jgi:hypothetical protein
MLKFSLKPNGLKRSCFLLKADMPVNHPRSAQWPDIWDDRHPDLGLETSWVQSQISDHRHFANHSAI